MKKEFTKEPVRAYSKKSDVELIEDLYTSSHIPAIVNTVNAILDMRTKKVINYLIEVMKENSKSTEKYNRNLERLTWWIFILTFIMVVASWLNTKLPIWLLFVILILAAVSFWDYRTDKKKS